MADRDASEYACYDAAVCHLSEFTAERSSAKCCDDIADNDDKSRHYVMTEHLHVVCKEYHDDLEYKSDGICSEDP